MDSDTFVAKTAQESEMTMTLGGKEGREKSALILASLEMRYQNVGEDERFDYLKSRLAPIDSPTVLEVLPLTRQGIED